MGIGELIEKIRMLENSGSGSNIACFLVAFDLLYFIKEEGNRERFVYEYYKNDDEEFSGNLKRICYYCEAILLEDGLYRNMLKSLQMSVYREELVDMYDYYDAMDLIENNNETPRKLISEGFKIRLLKKVLDSSNKDFSVLNKNVKDLKVRYERNVLEIITIITIFIALTIGMISGIGFCLEAFSNVTNVNVLNICLVASVVGFVIFNLFYAIFKFVASLCGKKLDKKEYVIFVDVAFAVMIVFFAVLVII